MGKNMSKILVLLVAGGLLIGGMALPSRSQGPGKIWNDNRNRVEDDQHYLAKPPPSDDEDEAPPPVSKFEGFIKKANFKYQKKAMTGEEGNKFTVYTIPFKTKTGQVINVFATELNLGPSDDGAPIKVGKVWSVLGPLSSSKSTATLFRKMAELNTNLPVGKVAADKQATYYVSDFWMRTADVETMKTHVSMALFAAQGLPKQLGMAPVDEEEEGLITPFGPIRQP